MNVTARTRTWLAVALTAGGLALMGGAALAQEGGPMGQGQAG